MQIGAKIFIGIHFAVASPRTGPIINGRNNFTDCRPPFPVSIPNRVLYRAIVTVALEKVRGRVARHLAHRQASDFGIEIKRSPPKTTRGGHPYRLQANIGQNATGSGYIVRRSECLV